MRTLVAAPVCKRKHYSLAHWAAATARYDRLVAVSEPDYEEVIRRLGIPVVTYEAAVHHRRPGVKAIYGPLFNAAWRAITSNADSFTHILALDSDVIPEGDILALMEEQYDPAFAFLRHAVPFRACYGRMSKGYETSCTMASVEDWKLALDKVETMGELTTLYEVVGDPNFFTHKDIDLMVLEHLDDGLDARR